MPDVKPLQKVLIANRGEIAVRVVRACKDAGIGSVAVYAEPDRDALFVRLADEAHSLGGSTPADSYLDIAKIIAVAEKSGADSVHPGYGFLAENAPFAQAVLDAGLVWIGPPPDAIDALGDKAKAKHIAEKARAPLAPGTKDALKDAQEAVAFAEENGLPIAIKAVYGGGGRGLKVARTLDEIPEAYESAVREAVGAFGRGECLVEKFLDKPRHVETQCLADQHGNVVVDLHPRLLAPAPQPEARRGGAGAVPLRGPGHRALRVLQAHPPRGRLLRRRHLRVPGRPGRLDLLPRGQHPPAGRALRLRGGHRHRPGPRDVPDRGRRGARVRRPRGPRPLHRVPDQRRGRRPQLHAGTRARSRRGARRRDRASASTAATRTARPCPARSTP